jgi:hypothetical protein
MKTLLIIAVLIVVLLIGSVVVWGPNHYECKKAFPMVVGCTLGKYETLTSGLIAALAALVAGWLALSGVQLQINTQKKANADRAKAHTENLARTLHAELADLVARCCFDSEEPWHRYWSENAPVPSLNRNELRRFAPAQPTIFINTSSDLASLGAHAPLRLVQFHNSLSALRRDIHDIAEGMTNHSATQLQIRQVAERFFLTLRPGLDALLTLAPMVPKADEVERAAIEPYDTSRLDRSPPEGTLRDRINRLLQMKSSETSQEALA